jgi:hypothetical protein
MPVRPFVETDIPQATDLYWHNMRRKKTPVPPAMEACFKELYFTNPWADRSFPSLVYVDRNGKVVGFVGAFVRNMSFCGKPISVSLGGNLIVHPEARSGLAAARLVGAFLSGKQDLQLTDSANDRARNVEERMGCYTIPALNIHWARPLRLGQYAAYNLSRLAGRAISPWLMLGAKPLSSFADAMAAKFSANPFRPVKSRLQGAELEVETLLQCMIEFRKGYSLWPEYDAASLGWLLSFLERRCAHGELRKVLVRDEDQKAIGWYIYYVVRGGVGEVVQLGGDQKFTKEILEHLFQDALEQGVIAVHGAVDLRHMADFSDKGCLFTCRGGWTLAKSKNEQILTVLRRGDALFSRLDGEWSLDPGILS